MLSLLVSCGVACGLAILVVRLARLAGESPLWWFYGLSAYLSSVIGLLIQKVLPRWLALAGEQRTLGSAWTLLSENWHAWWAPQTGDQWFFWVLTVATVATTLTGLLARWYRTWLGGIVCGATLIGLGCVMMQKMLAESIYLLPTETSLSKFGYVVIPAVTLSLPWLGQWLAARRIVGEKMAEASPTETPRPESLVHLLALLALTLSGSLLLATSGTLSLAIQLMVISSLPVAWMIEAWLPHRGRTRPLPTFAGWTSAGWLSPSAGLLVVLGHLFAEVPLTLGCLYAVSLWWVPWFRPTASAPAVRKWAVALLAAAPALIAGGIAAGAMIAKHG